MIDLENLTIVEALTLNAFRFTWSGSKCEEFGKWAGIFNIDVTLFIDKLYSAAEYDEATEGLISNVIVKHNKTEQFEGWWIHETAYKNACRKMAFPNVKIPGYTKARALKEARNTIQFVKDRCREGNIE